MAEAKSKASGVTSRTSSVELGRVGGGGTSEGGGSPAPAAAATPAKKPHPTDVKRDDVTVAAQQTAATPPGAKEFWGFLTHNWAADELGRSTHDRVAKVYRNLKAGGMNNWFDEEQMQGNVVKQVTAGIDASATVVVFITKLNLEKPGGAAARGENDNCFLEFDYASRIKDKQKMICVVMEPCCFDTSSWSGAVGMHLGGRLYTDCTSDEPAKIEHACENIRLEIIKVATGTDVVEAARPAPKVSGAAAPAAVATAAADGGAAARQMEEMKQKMAALALEKQAAAEQAAAMEREKAAAQQRVAQAEEMKQKMAAMELEKQAAAEQTAQQLAAMEREQAAEQQRAAAEAAAAIAAV